MKAVTCTNAKILIDPKSDAPTGAGKSASSTEALKRELHAQVLLPPLHRRSRVRVIESRPPRRRRPLLHGRRQIIGHDSGQSRSTLEPPPPRCGRGAAQHPRCRRMDPRMASAAGAESVPRRRAHRVRRGAQPCCTSLFPALLMSGEPEWYVTTLSKPDALIASDVSRVTLFCMPDTVTVVQ